MLLAIRWLWRLVRGEARPGWPLVWPLGIFAFATIVAALLAAHPVESLISARPLLLLSGLWIVRDAVQDFRTARTLLLGLLAASVPGSILGIVQTAYCDEWRRWAASLAEAAPWTGSLPALIARLGTKCHRARGFYSIYMTFGGVLTVVLLASLPDLVWTRARPRWTPIAWLLGFVALALTYVRGAWLGFAAGALVLGGSLRRGRAFLRIALVALAVIVLLLPGVRVRVKSIANPADPTSSERMLMWRSGVEIARDHWLTGVGPGQVKHVYPHYAAPEVTNKYRGHLHNSPLQIVVERGIVGLLAWLGLFGAFFVRAGRIQQAFAETSHERALIVGGVASTLGFLVGGLFEHNFGDSEVLLAATFVMGLVLSYSRTGSHAAA